MENKVSGFKEVNKQVKSLVRHKFEYDTLDSVIQRVKLLIRQNFGPDSYYINDLKEITESFPKNSEELYEPTYDKEQEYHEWNLATERLVNLLNTMSNDLESKTSLVHKKSVSTKQVFIVHGQDLQPVKELRNILIEVGIDPVILYEQPSKGLTIIEKLEEYSDVGFAFILLTPDDFGVKRQVISEIYKAYHFQEEPTNDNIKDWLKKVSRPIAEFILDRIYPSIENRARQNVILEFGYFIGRLGRRNVCCLYKGNIELPSDMQGICYLHFNDTIQAIKEPIINELKEDKIITE